MPDAAAERLREEAALWAVTLADDSVDDATRAACAAWCALDERHARLLAEMRRMWESVTPDTPAPQPARRGLSRQALGALVLLPCLLVAGAAMPWQAWLADERTGAGEIRHLTLEDGSRVALNSDSAIDIDFSGSVRRVQLLRGEVFVEVAHGDKPFAVVDRDGSAQALGTRYAVRREASDTLVTVTESRVRVQPLEGGDDRWVDVQAGQQVRFDRRGVTTDTVPAGPAAWPGRRAGWCSTTRRWPRCCASSGGTGPACCWPTTRPWARCASPACCRSSRAMPRSRCSPARCRACACRRCRRGWCG